MLKQGVTRLTQRTALGSLQRQISQRLLGWSALSVAAGVLLLVLSPSFWQGIGLQGVVWGVIDAGIAFFGLYTLRRERERADANTPEGLRLEAQNLYRLLLINTGLDVLYLVIGVTILTTLDTPFGRGNGVGIVVQGGFLFLFDAFYALQAKKLR